MLCMTWLTSWQHDRFSRKGVFNLCEEKTFDVSEFSADFGQVRPFREDRVPNTFVSRKPTDLGIRQEALAANDQRLCV